MLYVAMLILISFLIFVFVSDSFNPFTITKSPLARPRWKLGRAAGLASVASGLLAIALMTYFSVDQRTGLLIYLVVFAIMIVPSYIQFRKADLWG